MRKLLFTDLDGSLLDHYDYSYSAAQPALDELKQHEIPTILTTSKTAAEVVEIRERLGNLNPFVVENGAGVFFPKGSVSEKNFPEAKTLHSWRDEFQYVRLGSCSLNRITELTLQLKTKFDFNFYGFSEMSVQEVADCTGLALEQAVKAKQRLFSEPLLWKDSEENLDKFKAFVEPHGVKVIRGGRFVHVMGKSSKGVALQFLKEYYQKIWRESATTIALGDGENDVPMLQASDCAVVIRSPVNKPPKFKHPNKKITKLHGPGGWNQAVLDWLNMR